MIRQARIEDLNEVLTVIADAKELLKNNGSLQWQDKDGYPNYQTLKNDIDKQSLYVKTINGVIAGIAVLGKDGEPAYDNIYQGNWLNNEKFYVIHRLAVKKEYYRQGIAKEILTFFEQVTQSMGVDNIKIDTTQENIAMNNLLINCGYQKCGVIYLNRKDVYDKERLAYQKVLINNDDYEKS